MRSEETGSIPYEKSNNVETSLFLKQGRITRKAFFFRFFICVIIWLIVHIGYIYWAKAEYDKFKERGGGKIQEGAAMVETRYNIYRIVDFYAVPSLLAVFMLIQAMKRAHDSNQSGWLMLVPFYNVYLLFAKGTNEDNDYGLLPHSNKKSPSYVYQENNVEK